MAKTKFFAWRSGYHAKIAADVAGRELERIRKKNKGTLTADLVAAEAKPKSNPLHPQVYDLGQRAAAVSYYRRNAQQLIGAIQIKHEAAPEIQTRAYQVSTMERGVEPNRSFAVFHSTEEMLRDPEGRQVLLERALAEVDSWRKRYQQLSELARIFEAIDRAQLKLDYNVAADGRENRPTA